MARPTKDELTARAALKVIEFINDNLDVILIRQHQLTRDWQSIEEVTAARRRLHQVESYVAEILQRAQWRNDKRKKRKPRGG